MAKYFQSDSREWKEIHPGVFVSELHRYANGGGAAIFRLEQGTTMPEHDHSTGEHGYVIEGAGIFGDRSLASGDAFWMEVNERHEIRAVTPLVFFATSLPRVDRNDQQNVRPRSIHKA